MGGKVGGEDGTVGVLQGQNVAATLMAERQGDLVGKRMDPTPHCQASDACYAISLPDRLGQVA